MATIQLSKGLVSLVDEDIAEYLNNYKWFVTCKSGTELYYAATRIDGKRVRMNRFIWEYCNGVIPPKMDIDHISRDSLDNRIMNLRIATRSENNVNSKVRSDNTTGYKGVYYVKGRVKPYWAYVKKEGKRYGLGMYKTAEEAYKAYQVKAKELYGDFAA